jgi:hypothetical protein
MNYGLYSNCETYEILKTTLVFTSFALFIIIVIRIGHVLQLSFFSTAIMVSISFLFVVSFTTIIVITITRIIVVTIAIIISRLEMFDFLILKSKTFTKNEPQVKITLPLPSVHQSS